MISIRDLDLAKVYGEPSKKTGERKKIGVVTAVLFHPSEPRVIGFTVEPSDIALVIRRKDRYLTLDRALFVDGAIHTHGREAWGGPAAKRLGIDWDVTVAWAGMPVRAESGASLGTVRDALFDEKTGELNGVGLSGGTSRDIAIGVRDLPARMVRGFDGEAVIVCDEAVAVTVDGGAAVAAGKAAAVAQVKLEAAADAATEKVGEAAVAAGAAVGKSIYKAKVAAQAAAKSDTGKKALGWLKSIRDDVVDAMGPPDDD